MRDPDLVVRAQRAATALESAWCHWRNVHGLTAEQPPAVSSYVGYSLDTPWGEGRIVFGICAEEAEQLAGLLERHDCVGPIHASVTAMPADSAGGTPREDAPAPPGECAEPAPAGQPGAASLLSVPAPAPASAGQQPLPPGAVGSRAAGLFPRRPRSLMRDPDATDPLTAPVAPATQETETPIARAVSRSLEAAQASRLVPPSRIPRPPRGEQAAASVSGPWPRPASPGGSPGGDTAGIARPRPEAPAGPALRPAPPAADASRKPGVTAFRFRRPVAMTERPRPGPVTPAEPAGGRHRADASSGPAAGRPGPGPGRLGGAARRRRHLGSQRGAGPGGGDRLGPLGRGSQGSPAPGRSGTCPGRGPGRASGPPGSRAGFRPALPGVAAGTWPQTVGPGAHNRSRAGCCGARPGVIWSALRPGR